MALYNTAESVNVASVLCGQKSFVALYNTAESAMS